MHIHGGFDLAVGDLAILARLLGAGRDGVGRKARHGRVLVLSAIVLSAILAIILPAILAIVLSTVLTTILSAVLTTVLLSIVVVVIVVVVVSTAVLSKLALSVELPPQQATARRSVVVERGRIGGKGQAEEDRERVL